MGDSRAQLSLPLFEAAIGVLLVLAVTGGFVMSTPDPDREHRELSRLAGDTATVLQRASPDGSPPRIGEAVGSDQAFERARETVRRHLDRLLPATVLYRLETPRGTIGYATPNVQAIGRATIRTDSGPVLVEVWYV